MSTVTPCGGEEQWQRDFIHLSVDAQFSINRIGGVGVASKFNQESTR